MMTAQFDRFAQLAAKMEAAAAAGDIQAREWLLDLKTALVELRQQRDTATQRQDGGFLETVGQGLTMGLGFGIGMEVVDGLFDW
ncbi:hypothetical protein [Nocardia sp. NPDC020380]|uniref:hypothetical protein n=1 Tax=Nocardia sp. NPDC020380 TaxID=3364309 RepID=UPI0037BC7EF8